MSRQATVGQAPAAPAESPAELIARRTATSRTFQNPDGTLTTEIFPQAIHYQPAGSSDWAPIDTAFVPAQAGQKKASVDKSPTKVTVAPANDAGGFLAVDFRGNWVSLKPATTSGNSAAPVVDGAQADIADVFPGVDVRVFASPSSVNAFLVLKSAPASPSFTFIVDAPNLALSLDKATKRLLFKDAQNVQVGSILAPYAVDSTPDEATGGGRTTTAVSYSLSKIGGKPAVTVSVDPAWLATAVYPVYIDPTIYNDGTNTYGDAHVNQGNPTLNYANYKRPDSPGYYEMWLGESPSDPTYYNEDFIKFDLSSIADTTIDSASIEVRPYHQYYNAPTATNTWLRRVTASWTESAITWNNKPAVASGYVDVTGCVEGQQCAFSVTSLVQGWVSGTYSNYGIRLDENGNGPTYWKRLIASEQQTTTRPRLIVTSHDPVATPTTPTGPRNSRTLSWAYSDSGADPQSHFEIDVDTDSGFAAPLTYDGPQTAGAGTSAAIPATVTLTSGTTYYWRIRVKNGTSWSAWASSSFLWDATAPTATVAINGGAAYATTAAVTLNVTSGDAHSSVASTQASNDGVAFTTVTGVAPTWTLSSGDGTKTVYFRVTDAAGNVTTVSDAIVLDTIDPTGSISIAAGATYTTAPAVTLNLTYADTGSGPYQMQFNNEGGAWSGWQAVSPTKTWTLSAGDGTKTVNYQIKDNAGRVSTTSDTIILDTVNPTGSISIAGGATYATATTVMLKLTYADTGSGPYQMQFNNEGGAWSGWENVAPTKAWTLSAGDGTKTVSYQVKDNSGRISTTASDTIVLDTTNPSGSIVINSGAATTSSLNVTLSITGTDTGSGVASLDASNDNTTFVAVTGPDAPWTLTTGDGSKTVWLRVTDNAGRTTTVSDDIELVGSPTVSWSSPSVATTLAGGTTGTEAVDIVASAPIADVSVDVSSSLADVVAAFDIPDPYDLPAGHEYFPITFDVPTSTPAGTRVGTITVRSSSGGVLAELAVSLQVTVPSPGVVPDTIAHPSSSRIGTDADGFQLVTDELIVGLDAASGNPQGRILSIASAHNAVVTGSIPELRMYELQVPVAGAGDLDAARLAIESETNVTFASRSYIGGISDIAPDDPQWGDPWDENNVNGSNWPMELMRMPTAWATETGDRAVPVGIIDAGIDLAHEDLLPNADLLVQLDKRRKNETHGTHTTGTVCAKGNNALGVTGVAWNCSIRGYELGNPNNFRPLDVTLAMLLAARDGARVVNMSLGWDCGSINDNKRSEYENQFRQAFRGIRDELGFDVLWVIAAGNASCDAARVPPGNLSDEFPDNIITVASVSKNARLSDFSNFGDVVDVAAPGGNSGFLFVDHDTVLSTCVIGAMTASGVRCDTGYVGDLGTSMAAPHVTGLGALVLSAHPGMTSAQLKACIVGSANEHGRAIPDVPFHLVDAPSALACADVPYGSGGWTSRVYQTGTVPANWFAQNFDESGFEIKPAPFGSAGGCPLAATVKTSWAPSSEIVLRREITVQAAGMPVQVGIAIDNDVEVRWNGVDISGGIRQHENCTGLDRVVIDVPANLVQQQNLLAVHGIDRGGEALLDVRVTSVP